MSYEDCGERERERERIGINVLHEGDNMLYYKHEFQSLLLLSPFFFFFFNNIKYFNTHTRRWENILNKQTVVYI